ncbi:hypothetical protein [Reyranella sp.]|uniref:hypothetical protein n=1 Tax=Reyranella sp. TaxID=1929291 RepID=UPI003BA92856
MSALLAQLRSRLLVVAAIALGLLLVVARLLKAGRDQERADQAERNQVTRRRMEDAEARGPRTADDVDRRLRDGTF